MNNKHRKTYTRLHDRPPPKTITWDEVKSLLVSLGCTESQASGSRVRFIKDEEVLRLHRPHPGNVLKRYQIDAVNDFLRNIGVQL